jgi:hypothetical protein
MLENSTYKYKNQLCPLCPDFRSLRFLPIKEPRPLPALAGSMFTGIAFVLPADRRRFLGECFSGDFLLRAIFSLGGLASVV